MKHILELFRGESFKNNADIYVLRLGLGLTLVYAALSMMQDPTSWLGFVPDWVVSFPALIGIVLTKEIFLLAHSFFELALGLGLVFGYLIPFLSFIAFFDLLSILVFYGIDAITFRDFGLTAMALALFLRSTAHRK